MIDNAAILFSTIACVFMIVRAILLDRDVPRRQPPTPTEPSTPKDTAAWRSDWEISEPVDSLSRRR